MIRTYSAYLTSAIALVTIYYVFIVARKPKIYCGNKKMKKYLEHVKSLNRTYWPTPFYWEGRLQSIFGLIKRTPNSHKLPYTREIFKLRDGGQVALDYLNSNETVTGKKPIVLLLPGLTSSSQTSYVKTLCMAITKSGANVIVFNNRGIGGVPITSPRMFCAANIDDFVEVITHLQQKYPGEKFIGVGTSFGSIIYLQYLTKRPEEARNNFKTVFILSSVFDAAAGSASIETPLNKLLLNNAMCSDLVLRLKKFQPILEGQPWYNLEKLRKCKTVRDFDIAITVPQFGFESDVVYYRESSTIQHLHKLSVPVFSLNAIDDPIQPGKCLPMKQATESNSKLALITTSRGGHLGFLEGLLPLASPFHYMEKVLLDFLRVYQLSGEELNDI